MVCIQHGCCLLLVQTYSTKQIWNLIQCSATDISTRQQITAVQDNKPTVCTLCALYAVCTQSCECNFHLSTGRPRFMTFCRYNARNRVFESCRLRFKYECHSWRWDTLYHVGLHVHSVYKKLYRDRLQAASSLSWLKEACFAFAIGFFLSD